MLFMNNMDFQARKVRVRLDDTIGLKMSAGVRLRLTGHFPDHAELVRNEGRDFESGQVIETWLRPFEVAMYEVCAADAFACSSNDLGRRKLPEDVPDVQSYRLELADEPLGPEMEVHFGDPRSSFRSIPMRPTLQEFKNRGYKKRIFARRARMPNLGEGSHVLAIVLRLRKDGKWWRHRQPADLIQAAAWVGDQAIQLEAVPSFRQTENNQLAPWLVLRIRTNPEWSEKDFRVAINAYLPPEVECHDEGWMVPEWWERET